MTAHSSSIGPLSAFFAGMEYQDSLRYYRKEKPIVVSGTTGKSQLSVGIASCHRLLLPLESENPTFLEPFRPHLPNHLGPEYHELIAHNNQERQESELIKKIVEMAKREKDNTSGITKHIKEMCKKVLQSIYYMCSDKSEIIKEVVQRVLKEIPSDGNFKPPQDQVYINYLGDQLKNFIPYLMDALQRRKVNVFIDNLEKRGENLDNFSKRIGGSCIAVVVFSSRYTESERVMDGLVRIVECERQARLKVLPVFHNVPPSDVKRLKGKFGDHFRDKELLYGSDSPKIKQWKDAISYVSHKFLLAFNEKSGALEIDFVESIVKEVLAMLQAISTVESGYR